MSTGNDYGAAEFEDPHGDAFALALRQLAADLPVADRLPALIRGLAVESPLFAAPRADGLAGPALRLLAYDGILTEILGEELVAGRLDRGGLAALAALAEKPLAAPDGLS